MTAALTLFVFAILLSTAGSAALRRGSWTQRAPQWGVVAWQSLTTSIVLAGLLAAVALALCMLPLRFNVANLVGLTPIEVSQHYEPPGGDWIGVVALTLAASTLIVVTGRVAHDIRRGAQGRRAQLDTLALVGAKHPDGYTVIDHPTAVVYCVPGRSRTVVVSTTALNLLTAREMQLVLGHERTHLRARHDLALAVSGALAWTFGRARVFRDAHQQIAMLVEMQADDTAHVDRDRRAMARALVTLSTGLRPEATLGAGDTEALARVRRLTSPSAATLRVSQKALVGLVATVALSMPVALALAPAVEASSRECCSDVTRLH